MLLHAAPSSLPHSKASPSAASHYSFQTDKVKTATGSYRGPRPLHRTHLSSPCPLCCSGLSGLLSTLPTCDGSFLWLESHLLGFTELILHRPADAASRATCPEKPSLITLSQSTLSSLIYKNTTFFPFFLPLLFTFVWWFDRQPPPWDRQLREAENCVYSCLPLYLQFLGLYLVGAKLHLLSTDHQIVTTDLWGDYHFISSSVLQMRKMGSRDTG